MIIIINILICNNNNNNNKYMTSSSLICYKVSTVALGLFQSLLDMTDGKNFQP